MISKTTPEVHSLQHKGAYHLASPNPTNGDFNTTLNPVIDQYDYTTDPHKNAEQLFNNGLIMGNLLM